MVWCPSNPEADEFNRKQLQERKQKLFDELQAKKLLDAETRKQNLEDSGIVETEFGDLLGKTVKNKEGMFWVPFIEYATEEYPVPIPDYLYSALMRFSEETPEND